MRKTRFPVIVLSVLMIALIFPAMVARAQLPKVIPQEPREDGSIIHVVQFGDTLEGILEAYKDRDVTMESLQKLNNWEFPPQYIFVDQEIIILPPGSVSASAPATVPATATRPAPTVSAQATASISIAIPFAPQEGTAAPTENPTDLPTLTATPAPTETAIPASATPQPETETADEAEPTTAPTEVAVRSADAFEGVPDYSQLRGTLCVSFFNDANQNAQIDPDESELDGGQVTINDGAGLVVSGDSLCVNDLESGSTSITATAPDGFGLTTSNRLRVQIVPQRTQRISFGAAEGVTVPTAPQADGQKVVVMLPESYVSQPVSTVTDNTDLADTAYEYSGYIVLALALIVILGGAVLAVYIRLFR